MVWVKRDKSDNDSPLPPKQCSRCPCVREGCGLIKGVCPPVPPALPPPLSCLNVKDKWTKISAHEVTIFGKPRHSYVLSYLLYWVPLYMSSSKNIWVFTCAGIIVYFLQDCREVFFVSVTKPIYAHDLRNLCITLKTLWKPKNIGERIISQDL